MNSQKKDPCQAVCVSYQWYLTDKDSSFSFPLHNKKDKGITILKKNKFKSLMDLEAEISCTDFTDLTRLNSGLCFSLHASNVQIVAQ